MTRTMTSRVVPPTTAMPVGVQRNRYAVSTSDSGEILLTPLATIPKRELLIWENDELRASLLRGLAQTTSARRDDLLEGDDD